MFQLMLCTPTLCIDPVRWQNHGCYALGPCDRVCQ